MNEKCDGEGRGGSSQVIPSGQGDLRDNQYRDSSNLKARQELHQRFGTNPYRWFRWVFDHLDLLSRSRILELGCGPAGLWSENRDRMLPGWEVFLSDFSWGMVREAQAQLSGTDPSAHFVVADAQWIPFRTNSFDAVIANHMLYHVPDLDRALAEICRVLRLHGQFYAATNGPAHLQELGALLHRFDPSLLAGHAVNRPFDLDTGRDRLAPRFVDVRTYRYEDTLVVTEVKPLLDYVFSMSPPYAPRSERRAEFAQFVGEELASTGPIRISKEVGMLAAVRA